MTLHLHRLKGCAPAPLAFYLKALGILRLVGEQADRTARGWWQDEQFCLLTKLSREELESFFLERYEPTPLLSPWNAGSGFYRTWDARSKKLRNSKNARALDELASSTTPRLKKLREAVREVQNILPQHCNSVDVSKLSVKERNKLLILPDGDGPVFPVIVKDDSGKNQVQRMLVRESRATPYYECAFVEVDDAIKYPSLLGTGGNDGNIDYTGRFFESLLLVLFPSDRAENASLLKNSLFQDLADGFLTGAKGKVGQFLPNSAGGANITTGPGSQQDTFLNPWDYILALEGSMLLKVRATRRLDPNSFAQASAPFVTRPHAAGHTSAGAEKSERGEQWMPLWSRPATLADVEALFGEARLQLRRQTANRPIDAARAICRLGTARGVEAFTRYGYLERNGQSTLAVPLGRISVWQQPLSHLIDDLAPWMDRLQRRARDKNAPARLAQAERRLADAVFAALTHDPDSQRWQAILRTAVAIESLQATGTAIDAGPIPPLRPEWASNDVVGNSVEVRLARALGSAAANYVKGRPIDSVRHHWLPLERGARKFRTSDKRLVLDPRVVAMRRDPGADCAAVVDRRLIEAGMKGQRRLPLVSAAGCGASLGDLAALLAGEVDFDATLDLARAFMAVKWDKWNALQSSKWKRKEIRSDDRPDEAWLALRLCCLSRPLPDGREIPAEPNIVRRLLAGDAVAAIAIALRRLRSVSIRPPLDAGTTDPITARLWAAALVFPLEHYAVLNAVHALDPSTKGTLHA